MSKRDELREAIHDELSVLRVVNTALRNQSTSWALRLELEIVQRDSMSVLRRYLTQLHPSIQPVRPREKAADDEEDNVQ